jgi:hypothetical protein
MFTMNATQARNEWSSVVDTVIREKPQFIKRTRDYMILSNIDTFESFLAAYSFHAKVFAEDDGSVTLSLDEIDLAENGVDEHEAKIKLAKAIHEYAEDYYDDFAYWSRGNRKAHLPYVFRALILNDVEKIGGLIECRHGES